MKEQSPCSRGTARRDGQCVSPHQVAAVLTPKSKAVVLYNSTGLIQPPTFSLSFWVFIATELETGTVLSISPDIELLIDSRHFLFYPTTTSLSPLKTYIIAERWVLLSLVYSHDPRYLRSYIALDAVEAASQVVETAPVSANLAVLFAQHPEGLAEINAKLASFNAWAHYASPGWLVKHSRLNNPQNALASWRFNSSLLQTLSSASSVLTLIDDSELITCDTNYNFATGLCSKETPSLFRKLAPVTLADGLSWDSFTFTMWTYLDSADLALSFLPLGSSSLTQTSISLTRDSTTLLSADLSLSGGVWTFYKLSAYFALNWEVQAFQSELPVYNSTIHLTALSSSRVHAFVLQAGFTRNVAIFSFAIPGALLPGRFFTLGAIAAPTYAWQFDEKSGDIVYADFGGRDLTLLEGVDYEWVDAQGATCLTGTQGACELDTLAIA